MSKKLWSGSDLGPLPHESAMSILSRFAWRNALPAAALRAIVSGGTYNTTQISFLCMEWVSRESLRESTGWEFPAVEETEVLNSFKRLEHIFFRKRLRICPLCLECGYHSFWYQFDVLRICPLHGCLLTDQCSSCGEQLPLYDLQGLKLLKKWKCLHCRCPIYGAPIDLKKHLEFREQSTILITAFSSLVSLVKKIGGRLDSLRRMATGRHEFGKFSLWCRPTDFIRGFAFSGHELSGSCTDLHFQPVTSLSWQISMNRERTNGNQNHRSIALERPHRTRAVYLATIRRVRDWILSRLAGDETCSSMMLDPKCTTVDLHKWPSDVLAYTLLRHIFESTEVGAIKDPCKDICMRNYLFSRSTFHTFEGREPRQAWRSLFLGVFAVLYWMTERSRHGGVLHLSRLPVWIHDIIPKIEFDNGEGVLSGTIFFPTVPNLPVNLHD
jgi:hypothetical protein